MKRRATLLATTALLLSGCSSLGLDSDKTADPAGISGFGYQVPERAGAMAALNSAQPCCTAFNQLSYLPTVIGKDYPTLIDSNSPVFNFLTGPSYVAAYALPTQGGTFTLRVQTEVESAVFMPNILMLDRNFNPVRQISANKLKYAPAKLLKPNTYEVLVTVDRSYIDKPDNEYFMLLFTTPADLQRSSKVKSEQALYAESTNTVAPPNAILSIPHSPQGVVKVDLLAGSKQQQRDLLDSALSGLFDDEVELAAEPITAAAAQQAIVQAQQPKQAVQPVVAAVAPVAPIAAPSSVPAAPTATARVPDATPIAPATTSTMQPETEDFYNQLILQKVEQKQIDKALKLVEEAERAGSRTARENFIKAVKQLN